MTGPGMFFDSWYSFGRIIVTTAVGYVCLVALLRMTGKKTLTKMNVADFVFVVAIGDLLSNGIMTKDITLTDILLGLVLLILLRLAFQHVAQRSERLEKILNGKPVLLFRDGKCLEDRLRENEVSPEEVLAAMRQENIFDKSEVEAVILETDGTFSVVKKSHGNPSGEQTTLTDVEGAREWRRTSGGRGSNRSGGDEGNLRQRRTAHAAIALIVIGSASLLGGCGPKTPKPNSPKASNYERDTIAVRGKLIGYVGGFYEPESVRYDPDQDVYFISNVLGEGSAKDGNGYIVRVDAGDLSKSSLFAVGGKNGVHLDAPKGMAIQGDTLWVADIDVLRGFDRHSGKPVATIDFKPLGAVLLNDAGAGPDGSIYISDTGILMTDKGVIYVGGDKIFRLAPGRTIQIVAHGNTLGRPNGVTWDATSKQWLVVSFAPWHSELYALHSDSTRTVLARGTGEWDGLEMLADGKALVTSWSDSSVHLISGRSDEKVIRGVSTPADLGIDTKRGVIAVPQIMSGRVEFWTVPKG